MFNPIAIIKIKNLDEMRFELYRDTFDSTGNFIELANNKFYDGLYLFNYNKDVYIQTGCKKNNGTTKLDYTIRGEFAQNGFVNVHKHKFGSLGMVRSIDRDSASCQFYISLNVNSHFDDEFAVFGDIKSGHESLEKINKQAKKWQIEYIKINDRGEEIPRAINLKG